MKTSIHLKRIVTATGLALAVMVGAPVASHYLSFNGFDVISQAHAESDGGGKGSMGSGGQGSGGKASGGKQDKGSGDQGSGSAQGKKDTKTTGGFKGSSGSGQGDENRDPTSDRPDYAGAKGGKSGGGGGKPGTAGSKKGDLYGDMYILIRDPVTGVASTETLVINGVETVFPLVQAYDAAGNPIPGVSVPRDPATGDLLTKLPDGTAVFTAEVDLGRLSVLRSPDKVLEKAYDEAISKLTATGAVITLDAAGRLVVNGTAIDSPLENLALYVAAMSGTLPSSISGIEGFSAASMLAAAADKTGTVNLDVVMYLDAMKKISPDLSTFTYDRAATYDGKMVDVLQFDPATGSYKVVTVNLYTTLFEGKPDTTAIGAIDFAQATDDALQVIEYLHENSVTPAISATEPVSRAVR